MPLNSFYTALTGLNNNTMAINVIGNNLANMNTTAYKTNKVTFSEMLSGSVSSISNSGNPVQVGIGSYVDKITPMFTQGSISSTGRSLDAAISGNGFFVVSTPGGQGYTRAGSFGFNTDGELITSDGFNVMGYKAVNGELSVGGGLETLTISKGSSLPPKATENIYLNMNLDSREDAYTTVMQAYDSLGGAHAITLNFTKTAPGEWTYSATIPATDTGGLASDPPVEIGTGPLTFTDGILTAPTTNPTLSFTGLASGAPDFDITYNLLNAAGAPTITSYAQTSNANGQSQDGQPACLLRDISIDSSGVLVGLYDGGITKPLAQLAIADFPNVEGLMKYTGSTLMPFLSSGEASIGTAGTGGRGGVVGSSLELSNVDIAQEFTSLIIAQRGYQANSRVITTTDELYQESLNLKR
jgi:flagellar hook protein FlgE